DFDRPRQLLPAEIAGYPLGHVDCHPFRVSSEVSSLIWPRIMAGLFLSGLWRRGGVGGIAYRAAVSLPLPAPPILQDVAGSGERGTDDRADFGPGAQDEAGP